MSVIKFDSCKFAIVGIRQKGTKSVRCQRWKNREMDFNALGLLSFSSGRKITTNSLDSAEQQMHGIHYPSHIKISAGFLAILDARTHIQTARPAPSSFSPSYSRWPRKTDTLSAHALTRIINSVRTPTLRFPRPPRRAKKWLGNIS